MKLCTKNLGAIKNGSRWNSPCSNADENTDFSSFSSNLQLNFLVFSCLCYNVCWFANSNSRVPTPGKIMPILLTNIHKILCRCKSSLYDCVPCTELCCSWWMLDRQLVDVLSSSLCYCLQKYGIMKKIALWNYRIKAWKQSCISESLIICFGKTQALYH